MRPTRATQNEFDEEYARVKLYQNVFGSSEGQKVLKDLIERVCGVNRTPFAADPYVTAHNVGKQDVARVILALCNPRLDPQKPNVITDRKND
jgi:hypothetical protein